MNPYRPAALVLLLLLLAGSFGAVASPPWPAGILVPGSELWRSEFAARSDFDAGEAHQGPHLVASPDGTTVFAAAVRVEPSGNGHTARVQVAALDAQDGERLWIAQAGSAWGASGIELLPSAGLVVVSGGNTVSALNVTDGGLRWGISSAYSGTDSAMAAANGRVFIGGLSYPDGVMSRIHAVDGATGELVWQATLPETVSHLTTSADGNLVFAGGARITNQDSVLDLLAFDAATGAKMAHVTESELYPTLLHASADGSTLVVVAAANNTRQRVLTAYDLDDLTLRRRWSAEVPMTQVAAVDVASDVVVLTGVETAADGVSRGRTSALALDDGSAKWNRIHRSSTSDTETAGTSVQLAAGTAYVAYTTRGDDRYGYPVYVPGEVTLVAHDLLTGLPLWSNVESPASPFRHSASLALSPDGARVHVAGENAVASAIVVRAVEARFAPLIADALPQT